jgi:hypothetical protein
MNDTERKIEIFAPFGEAYELMKKILFQPFDLGKWFVIGFAAFLAHLGGGFNFRYNYDQRSPFLRELTDAIHQIPSWLLITGIGFLFVLILGIMVVFTWLRSRGRFMFIECIVKNRGTITEPWREFRKQGNSYFLFVLLVSCVFFAVVGLLSLPFMIPVVRGVTFVHLHDTYLISMIILWGLVIVLLVLAWALIAHFMVTVMYCRRCLAHEAFRIALSLIAAYPGEITLYCSFWIVLGLGAVMIACVSTCLTCCIAALPYIGTVILLPLFVWLRAFGLCFLRQFGPEYNAWARITPPEIPPTTPTLSA